MTGRMRRAYSDRKKKLYLCFGQQAYVLPSLGVKVRNTKMDLKIYGTWRLETFEKLMMKF